MKIQSQLPAALCRTCILALFLLLQFKSRSQESMRANLFVVGADGTRTLMDGNLTDYHNYYSSQVDWDDAWKLTNPGENFSIFRSNTNLVIERRSIISNADTTFFKMWNMRLFNYEIKVMTRNLNHPGLTAYMIDHYLNTQTPVALNDTTYIPFTVFSNPGSYSQLRFELIFANLLTSPVPVTFTGLKLLKKENDVHLEWGVENEISIKNYTVEHAADGAIFNQLQEFLPSNTTTSKVYSAIDPGVSNGDHFYRIKATGIGGKIQYSQVAKISSRDAVMGINVYPNPVVNKTIQLQLASAVAGKYSVNLLGMNGMLRSLGSININANQSSQSLPLPANIVPGIYRVQLAGPDALYIKSIIVF